MRQLHRFAVRTRRKTFCPQFLVSPLPSLQGRTVSSPWYRHAECFPFVSGLPARWLSVARPKLSEPRSLEGPPGARRGLHIPNGEGFVKWKENLEQDAPWIDHLSLLHAPVSRLRTQDSRLQTQDSSLATYPCFEGPFSVSLEEVHSLPSARNPYRAPPVVLPLGRVGSTRPAGGASSSNSSSFRWMSGRSVNAA